MPEMSEQERMDRAVRCVRHFIRDKRELNRLLLGEFESSDTEVRLALINALRDWQNTPPPLGNVTLKNHPAKELLLLRAAIELIRSSMLWHAREHMPSTDGGTTADDHAKTAEYSMILQIMQNEYDRQKSDIKTSQNINAALGNQGVPSEYSYYYAFGEDLAF